MMCLSLQALLLKLNEKMYVKCFVHAWHLVGTQEITEAVAVLISLR